ncbi:MAG: helix-turn-helix domain-containing protein [Hyphomonadaceae bacterium]
MRDLHLDTQGRPAAAAAFDGITLGRQTLRGVHKRFEHNCEIFGADERADYVYRVVSGAVRTLSFSADGRRQILAFHLPGDVFGFELADVYTYSAEAVSDVEVVLVARSALEKAAANDAVAARALLKMASDELHQAHEHALVLGRKGAGERVAAFLMAMAKRISARREMELPMSRADIADHLALTIETVSRAFTQMEREAAIALPSARHVVVRDWGALESLQAA